MVIHEIWVKLLLSVSQRYNYGSSWIMNTLMVHHRVKAELVSRLNSYGAWKAWRYLSGNQRIQRWQDVGRVISGLQKRTVIYLPNNCSHGNCKTWQFDFLRDILDRWSLQPSIYKSRAGLKPNYALSIGQKEVPPHLYCHNAKTNTTLDSA